MICFKSHTFQAFLESKRNTKLDNKKINQNPTKPTFTELKIWVFLLQLNRITILFLQMVSYPRVQINKEVILLKDQGTQLGEFQLEDI